MIIDNLDELPDMFKEGFRGLLLLYRNKDGQSGNAQRKALKKVSRNKDEWMQIVLDFQSLQDTAEYHSHRIYASVNPRNIAKAIHEFKSRQLSVDYGTVYERDWFYVDLQNRFFSCLMNPNCRMSSNFLVDCDSEDEYIAAKEKIPEEFLLYEYLTKNGRHIITRPFNPNEIQVPVKKDELMFIG